MKKKKVIGTLLAATMAVSMLAGCGESTETKDTAEKSESETSETYNLVIENVTLGAEYKDTAAVEEAINKITEPAIGCTVTILNVGIADHANRMSMMIAGGEKIDLCMTGLTTNLVSMVKDGMLCDVGEYMDTYGKELETMFAEDLEAGKVNGTLYGIPANNACTNAGGFLYNKEIADAAGVTIPERCTLDELLEAYEKVHEANPELYFTSMGDGGASIVNTISPRMTFGDSTCTSYGVIADLVDGGTTIQNWFATDEAKEYYTMVKEWQDKGMVPSDSLTSGVITQDMIKSQACFGGFTGYTPVELSTRDYGFELGITQLTDAYKDTDAVQERMWGIPVTCEKPEKAIEFLSFMYTNTEVANLLNHGIEGLNYELTDQEGIIERLDDGNQGYGHIFSMFGDQTKIYYNAPLEEGIQEKFAEFVESAKPVKTLGYVFDSTPIAAKAAAVSNVVQQYGPSLEVGLVDNVDEALARIVEAMNQAGMEEIIAENQAQLDKWLESQD